MCTHCKRPTRTFLQAKSHEFVSAKKERERSVLDRVSDSMTNMATKLIMSDMDERFLAMKEYIDLFEAKMMALQEANTGMQEERKELIRFELCWEGGGSVLFVLFLNGDAHPPLHALQRHARIRRGLQRHDRVGDGARSRHDGHPCWNGEDGGGRGVGRGREGERGMGGVRRWTEGTGKDPTAN